MPDDRFLHRLAGHSQKVNLLTDLEYRVWTQYLLSADDFGVMRGTHLPLQDDNDHLATRPAKVIQRCLDVLVKVGLIRRFEHQGKPYVYQHDWQSWQKVSYPRTTTLPAPAADAIAECDESTRQLFGLHPGGAGKKRGDKSVNGPQSFREHSQNIPEIVSEDSPLMRAGAPAKRLTANGQRLTANGSEGGPGETDPPMDVWFRELVAAYPASAVSSGHLTEQAFFAAVVSQGSPAVTFTVMLGNLENQKRGHQWRVKGMVPRLDRWLKDGLWKQVHDADPPAAEQVSARTMRMLGSV